MNEVISQLDRDKIRINWNKNPIKMDDFLSFLTVDVTRSDKHFGSDNGWTKLHGDDDLAITGGEVNVGKWPDHKKIELLVHIEYKRNLSSPYHNFVNPFYLFDIMTDDGKKFFVDYYKDDIEAIFAKAKNKARIANDYLDGVSSFCSSVGIDIS